MGHKVLLSSKRYTCCFGLGLLSYYFEIIFVRSTFSKKTKGYLFPYSFDLLDGMPMEHNVKCPAHFALDVAPYGTRGPNYQVQFLNDSASLP